MLAQARKQGRKPPWILWEKLTEIAWGLFWVTVQSSSCARHIGLHNKMWKGWEVPLLRLQLDKMGINWLILMLIQWAIFKLKSQNSNHFKYVLSHANTTAWGWATWEDSSEEAHQELVDTHHLIPILASVFWVNHFCVENLHWYAH